MPIHSIPISRKHNKKYIVSSWSTSNRNNYIIQAKNKFLLSNNHHTDSNWEIVWRYGDGSLRIIRILKRIGRFILKMTRWAWINLIIKIIHPLLWNLTRQGTIKIVRVAMRCMVCLLKISKPSWKNHWRWCICTSISLRSFIITTANLKPRNSIKRCTLSMMLTKHWKYSPSIATCSSVDNSISSKP